MLNLSPTQEVAKRVAEAAPGLAAGAKLVAMRNLIAADVDHRKRISDSHRWQAKALGMDDPGGLPEDDSVANFVVTGDVYGSDAAEIIQALSGQTPSAVQPAVAPPAATVSPTARKASWLPKAALLAAGLLGSGGVGAALPWLLGAFDSTHTTTTIVEPGNEFELEVIPGGAMR